jgi:hypothetical protein
LLVKHFLGYFVGLTLQCSTILKKTLIHLGRTPPTPRMAKLLAHSSDVAHPLTWHYIKNVPTYELKFYYDAIWESLDTGIYGPVNPFAMEQSLKRIEKEVARRGYRATELLHTVEYVPVPVFVGVMDDDDDDDDLKEYRPPTGPY